MAAKDARNDEILRFIISLDQDSGRLFRFVTYFDVDSLSQRVLTNLHSFGVKHSKSPLINVSSTLPTSAIDECLQPLTDHGLAGHHSGSINLFVH